MMEWRKGGQWEQANAVFSIHEVTALNATKAAIVIAGFVA